MMILLQATLLFLSASAMPDYRVTVDGMPVPMGVPVYDPRPFTRVTIHYWVGSEMSTITVDPVIRSIRVTICPHIWYEWTCTAPTMIGDFDLDNDIDQSDFGHLQQCFSGRGVTPRYGCWDCDLDRDADVDQDDFRVLAKHMMGAK